MGPNRHVRALKARRDLGPSRRSMSFAHLKDVASQDGHANMLGPIYDAVPGAT